ncbi:MAG: hypothetical protein H0W89_00835 [Candidatus Levybacteria bacterium]|nr:hypothetical protein [Candidatus Levybacteria bacterium]
MNIGGLIPQPNIQINRPEKVSNKGNLYRMAIDHKDSNGNQVRSYEVWATKEAVQQHFNGITENPREYQLRKYAKMMYEKRMRSSGGHMAEAGMLATSQDVTHGNPKMWPMTLSHPEVKL